jgi:hypothetical protein
MENFGKLLLDEINFARNNPAEYAKKLLAYEQFFKDKMLIIPGQKETLTKEGFGAFYEAAHHMTQMSPVPALTLNSGLVKVAEEALVDLLKINDLHGVTQLNMDFYVEKWGFVVGSFNEAIELGSSTAETVVAHLLVDDGDLDRGNRKHMMSPNFRLMGFASGVHTIFGHATVVTYSRTFFGHCEEPILTEEHKEEIKENKKDTQIAKTPKVTYTMKDDHEIISDKGKTNYHTEIEKKEVKKDGYLSYSYSKVTKSSHSNEHDPLPEDCVKIDKDEKIIIENGKKKKITTIKKTMKDGSIKTETSKADI